jgi:hypothetical protein
VYYLILVYFSLLVFNITTPFLSVRSRVRGDWGNQE